MKLLSALSPGETMLLIESSCSLKDLMKVTFMDLLLKRVIEIKVENQRVLVRDKYAKKVEVIKAYNYVIKGKNFEKYNPKAHEVIMLSPYQKGVSIKILFRHFVKMVYENAESANSFKSSILHSQNIKELFKLRFLYKLFGMKFLSKQGADTKSKILNHLKPIDENIQNLLNEDKKKALELLLGLGGNIFLLKNLDFSLLQQIDKHLIKASKSVFSELDDTADGWWYYLDFFDDSHGFDSFFSGFDNTIDSFDTNFDAAGCSSCDNGCSSCGGFD